MITYKLDSLPNYLKENALKEELLPSFYSCFAQKALRINVDITLHKHTRSPISYALQAT